MRKWVLLVTILALSVNPSWAWKTEKHLKTRLDRWIGRNVADLIAKMGPPSSENTLLDGSKVILFRHGGLSTYTLPSSTPDTYVRTLNYVPPVGSGYVPTYTTRVIPGQRTSQTYSLRRFCNVTFNVSAEGVIQSYVYRGNNCRAEKP
jgi:hypothetical protein